MRKKFFAILLMVSLSCMFTGCTNEVGGAASAPADFQVNVENTGNSEIPEPTVAPTPEPTPTPILLDVEELSFANDGVQFVYGYGGVIITKLNDLYGATDYEGNVIVENSYPYCYQTPNADGHFLLADADNNVYVFDKSGENVYTVANPKDIKINESIVSYAQDPSNSVNYYYYVYNLNKKALVDIPQNWQLRSHRLANTSAYIDGKVYVYDKAGIKEVNILDITCKSITTYEHASGTLDCAYKLNFLDTPVDGYGVVKGGNTDVSLHKYYVEEGESAEWSVPSVIGVLSTKLQKSPFDYYKLSDRAERKLISMPELCEYLGVTYEDSFEILSYEKNGVSYRNKEQLVALHIPADEPQVHCLLDFSKAELNKRGLVTNIEDVVVFTGDYVCLSDSDYFLVSEGEDFFYIDASGNKVADYDDCTNFINGLAAILEDGMVYIVDEKFNKVSMGYPADDVTASGDFFELWNGNDVRCIRVLDYIRLSTSEPETTESANAAQVADAPTKTGYEMIAERDWNSINVLEENVKHEQTMQVNLFNPKHMTTAVDEYGIEHDGVLLPYGQVENYVEDILFEVKIWEDIIENDEQLLWEYYMTGLEHEVGNKVVHFETTALAYFMDLCVDPNIGGSLFIDGASGNALGVTDTTSLKVYSQVASEGVLQEELWQTAATLAKPINIWHNGEWHTIYVKGTCGAAPYNWLTYVDVTLYNVPVDYYDYVFGYFGDINDGTYNTLTEPDPADIEAGTVMEFDGFTEASIAKTGIHLFQIDPATSSLNESVTE